MKRSKLNEKAYSKLLWRLFVQILIVLGLSVLLVLVLRQALHGKMGNIISRGFQVVFQTDWDSATLMYTRYVRNYLELIILFAMVASFLIMFQLCMPWFTRYFDQMVQGIDQLANESNEPIQMDAELEFMETVLNEVKDKLKLQAMEAQQAERQKNDLIVYLAHDIKTPLTSVLGYLSLINENPDLSEADKTKYMQIALEKTHRLQALIDEFFEITRYTLQTVSLDKQPIDLSYMMIQIADEAYPQLLKKNQHIDINVPEETYVYADSEKLARVFNNLLKNAIAYSPAGSKIKIAANSDDHYISIGFSNPGTIPKSELNLVFEKFHRLDSARSSASGGAGLGLAIAKDIVQLHGGKIQALCSNERTIFTVSLPRYRPSTNPPS